MNKWIIIVLAAMLGLYACAGNKPVVEAAPKAEITAKVAILPLKAADSPSRYITKILTVRDLGLTFDKQANYTLLDLDETELHFKETGYTDVEDLTKEELIEISKNLASDVIITGNVSENRSGVYNISMVMFSTLSTELKQVSFNVGKEKNSRLLALEEGMMKELDNFVSGEMDKIFNIATNYYNNENYVEAERALKQVVALKPDKAEAYYYLGNTYLKLDEMDLADWEDLADLVDLADLEGLVDLVDLANLEDLADVEELADLEGLVDLEELSDLVNKHINKYRTKLAEENYLKAYELNPQDHRLTIALIDLYDKTNQPAKRITLMEKVAETSADAETWLAVGNLYDQQGNKTKAKESFRKALVIDPEYSAANVRLAFMLYDEGSFAESIPMLEKAFELAPDNDLISRRLATAYQRSGRIQDAIARYEGLIKNDPNNVNAYLNLVSLYRTDNNDAKAIETINALKKVDPNNPYAYLNLAAIYLSQTKYNEAETNANLTISKNASLYQPYVILASVFQSRGTDAYNNYLDLDRQASQAVGKKATDLRKQRDTAKSNAQSLLGRARDNLNNAKSRTTESEAVSDINTRLSRVNDILSKL